MSKMTRLDERTKRILEFISPKKADKILVIGTGVYPRIEYILFNSFKCKNITSGDIDLKNIRNAEKLLPQLKFVYLDAQKKFPFKNNSFDKVILTEVLEHLNDENIALSEIRRVLKAGGKLIISVPKRRWFNIFSPISWIQHKREYSEKRISGVLSENGFRIKKLLAGGNIFDLFNLWLHLILKHLFGRLHIDYFFQDAIDKSYKQGFKGEGTDIIIQAEKKR